MNSSQKTTQAMVVAQSSFTKSQKVEKIALFDTSGNPINLSGAGATGDTVHVTTIPTATGALAVGDTVDQALAKLQARIVALGG